MIGGPEDNDLRDVVESLGLNTDLTNEVGRIAVPSGCDDYEGTTRREILELSRRTPQTPEEIIELNRELSSRQPR